VTRGESDVSKDGGLHGRRPRPSFETHRLNDARVKDATPKLTWAKAGAASSSGPAGRPHGLRGSRTQNIENNPMQSSLAVAGVRDPAKAFLTRRANHL
jgi:hypothetical protein